MQNLFSPRAHRPAILADMTRAQISEYIQSAQKLIRHHESVARNGDPAAEHYYFYIPEVAADMGTARYTLNVCFAELNDRKTRPTEPEREPAPAESEIARFYKSDAARFLDALAA